MSDDNEQPLPQSPAPTNQGKKLIVILLLALTGLFLGFNLAKLPELYYTMKLKIKERQLEVYSVKLTHALTINLSDNVKAEDLKKHLEIIPKTAGKINAPRDSYSASYIFVPSSPFKWGNKYTVKITKGLKSVNGKTLLSDFVKNYIYLPNDISGRVEFRVDDYKPKVIMFSSEKSVSFATFTNGEDVDVEIISAKRDEILNFLNYKEITRPDNPRYPERQPTDYVPTYEKSSVIKRISINSNQGYRVETNLPIGAYFAVAKDSDGKKLKALLFFVNKTGLLVRQDDQKLIAASYDINSSQPVTGNITLELFRSNEAPQIVKTATLVNSISNIPVAFDEKIDFILGDYQGEEIFVPLNIPQTQADIRVEYDLSNKQRVFLYTDRPIYKPGDTVHFRGLVRVDNDALYKLPTSPDGIRIVLNNNQKPDWETKVFPDANGVFKGELKVPSTSVSGSGDDNHTQYLYASLESNNETFYDWIATAMFDVAKYEKPEFELSVDANDDDIIQNEKLLFTVHGNYFENKKPLANTEATYTLYKRDYYEVERAAYNKNFNITSLGMCGAGGFDDYLGEIIGSEKQALTFNDRGEGIVDFSKLNEKFDSSKQITLVVEKNDSNGNKITAAKTVTIHATDTNIFFPPSSTSFTAGQTIKVPFVLESLTGEKLAQKNISYKMVNRIHNSDSPSTNTILSKGTAETDGNGRGMISVKAAGSLADSSAYLVVSYKDAHGNTAKSERYIYITNKETINKSYRWDESTTHLKVVSPQNTYQVGETMNLSVNSPSDLYVLMSLERGRVYDTKTIHLKKGDNTVAIPVTANLSPSITVVFSFFDKGKYYSEGLSLNIPAMHKLLQVKIESDKQTYSKYDQNAILVITTKDARGNPVSANVSLGVVDKAIYALRKDAMTPIHSSFYYFRSRSTNASSSLTPVALFEWGGGGGGGGEGGGGLHKLVDTLYWNPDLKTDGNGRAEVSVPLANFSTIWKAIAIASDDNTNVGQNDIDFNTTN